MINVRYHAYYDHNATTGEESIAGYVVYAWIGHPLLGEVLGTRQYVTSLYKARKLATKMRKELSQ